MPEIHDGAAQCTDCGRGGDQLQDPRLWALPHEFPPVQRCAECRDAALPAFLVDDCVRFKKACENYLTSVAVSWPLKSHQYYEGLHVCQLCEHAANSTIILEGSRFSRTAWSALLQHARGLNTAIAEAVSSEQLYQAQREELQQTKAWLEHAREHIDTLQAERSAQAAGGHGSVPSASAAAKAFAVPISKAPAPGTAAKSRSPRRTGA